MLRFSRKAVLLVLAVALIISFSAPTFAATTSASAEFVIGMSQYFVNNQTPGISMDAAPYIDATSGRTLVPVRYLGNALGATTNWDGTTQEVTVSTAAYNISMNIGSTTLTVNGQASQMDVAPVINNGRTYLPARWVAQALGYTLYWDATNQIVLIYPANGLGRPGYNNVITQAQQNAAQPWQVQKLESALGVTITNGGYGTWGYEPQLNPDGSPNMSFINQYAASKESFVNAGYWSSDGSVNVSIQCSQLVDPGMVTVDLSPLQTVLEAFFPGQDAAIQQAMAYAQKCVTNTKTTAGLQNEELPADVLMINGLKVGVAQGGTTYAGITILGS